jgi:ComF family protein
MALLPGLRQSANDLSGLFFPDSCAACGDLLHRNEQVLCFRCLAALPLTGFHRDPENEVARLFWGRIPLEQATSFMFFSKDSRYRRIVHELKYRGRPEAGTLLGRLFGHTLQGTGFATADLIHPVPLHPARFRFRGYNQSALIARGMSEAMGIPMAGELITRRVDSRTQTRRHRYERWENVRHIFCCEQPEQLKNRHILLVDDVITTGATLEACAACIADVEGIRISIASLAYAKLLG